METKKTLYWLSNLKKKTKHERNVSNSTELLQSIFQNSKSPLGNEFQRWKLWMHWEKIVGPDIAKHSTPVSFRDGNLYVWVKNSVWLQEMSFLAGPLKDKINVSVGWNWVSRLIFTTDRKSVPTVEESSQDLRDFLSK
jgi:predicted nucleic acid-binding Zn ribbon protein